MEPTIERKREGKDRDRSGAHSVPPGAGARLEGRLDERGRAPGARAGNDEHTLQAVVDAWHARGAPVPVAVVVSIFDDLFGGAAAVRGSDPSERSDRGEPRALSPLDVMIDGEGNARLRGRSNARHLGALVRLFARVLGGEDGSAMPPRAVPLVARALDATTQTGRAARAAHAATDAEQVRGWMREALGPPARRDEVLSCFAATAAPRPGRSRSVEAAEPAPKRGEERHRSEPLRRTQAEDATSSPWTAAGTQDWSGDGAPEAPFRAGEPDPARAAAVRPSDPHEIDTLPPQSVEAFAAPLASIAGAATADAQTEAVAPEGLLARDGEDSQRPETPALASDVPETSWFEPSSTGLVTADAPVARVESARPSGPRPVVRHHWRRTSVTVQEAPAARRSARPSLDNRDMLSIPGERSPWVHWLIFALAALVVAVLWLRWR